MWHYKSSKNLQPERGQNSIFSKYEAHQQGLKTNTNFSSTGYLNNMLSGLPNSEEGQSKEETSFESYEFQIKAEDVKNA